MEVRIVEPSGFCFGVKKALEIAKKARVENKDGKIYIVGSLVHNEDVIKGLEADGFIILDEREKPLEQHLLSLNDGSIIVFSAHGHAPYLDKIAMQKRMKIYDATCVFVKNNEQKTLSEIDKGNEVIYIGIANHAETIGVMGIEKEKIFLFQPNHPFDYSKVASPSPLVISQTTMSENEISSSINDILEHIPNALIFAKQCFETEKRQSAAINEGKEADCFIVIGGKNSNNTKRLAMILEEAYPTKKCIAVLNEIELKPYLSSIKECKHIMLVSGASTSESTINECKNLILNNN